MNGVAAEIAQKIRVFFQHCDRDAGSREQQSQHSAGGSATGDAAADLVHTSVVTSSRGMINAHAV